MSLFSWAPNCAVVVRLCLIAGLYYKMSSVQFFPIRIYHSIHHSEVLSIKLIQLIRAILSGHSLVMLPSIWELAAENGRRQASLRRYDIGAGGAGGAAAFLAPFKSLFQGSFHKDFSKISHLDANSFLKTIHASATARWLFPVPQPQEMTMEFIGLCLKKGNLPAPQPLHPLGCPIRKIRKIHQRFWLTASTKHPASLAASPFSLTFALSSSRSESTVLLAHVAFKSKANELCQLCEMPTSASSPTFCVDDPLTETSGSFGAWYATSTICVLPFPCKSCSYSVVVERGTSCFAILELTASCVDCWGLRNIH